MHKDFPCYTSRRIPQGTVNMLTSYKVWLQNINAQEGFPMLHLKADTSGHSKHVYIYIRFNYEKLVHKKNFSWYTSRRIPQGTVNMGEEIISSAQDNEDESRPKCITMQANHGLNAEPVFSLTCLS